MAERKPLVLVNGELKELPAGDTLPSTGGGSVNIDGGLPDSDYSAVTPLDGGTP